jgi:hypothetical protein
VEGTGTYNPVEDGVLKWQFLYAGSGEVNPWYIVSLDTGLTLP